MRIILAIKRPGIVSKWSPRHRGFDMDWIASTRSAGEDSNEVT
jgi:hypothetical protein